MNRMKEYFIGDIERITGVRRLRLFHWVKQGYIVPSRSYGQGYGTKNVFSRDDIIKIALLKHLIEQGFHAKLASKLINDIKGSYDVIKIELTEVVSDINSRL